MPGPLPKRNAERRRRHKDSQNEVIRVRTPVGRVRIPAVPDTTHAVARRWYESLAKSAQAGHFEASDWVEALFVCEAITLALAGSALAARAGKYEDIPLKAAQVTAILQGMDRLLTTEWARRHARLEIERQTQPPEVPPGVADIERFRERMERERAAHDGAP